MLRGERGQTPRRGVLLLAVCGVACGISVTMAIREWRATVDPVAPAAVPSPGAHTRSAFREASKPSSGGAVDGTAATATLTPPAPSRRHHRGNRAPAELAAVHLESLGTRLAAELGDLKPWLEACTRTAAADHANPPAQAVAAIQMVQETALASAEPALSGAQKALLHDLDTVATAGSRDATPRSLRLDVETGDGEVRIVGVPAPDDGSAFYRCAEHELKGRTVASPGAIAGRRVSVMLPL
jgi:hypothetical protein